MAKPRALSLVFTPIPNMRLQLTFSQEKSISEGAAGVGGSNWYRVGGAFDPDTSVGGPSCLGFNNYAGLFTNYRVHAMRIRVEGFVNATGPCAFAVVTLMPNPRQIVAPSDPALWAVEPGSVSVACCPQAVGGNNRVVLDRTYLPWELLKIPKSEYMSEADYSSLVTTTPLSEPYLMLGVNGVGTTIPAQLIALVRITYLVEFFKPVVLA